MITISSLKESVEHLKKTTIPSRNLLLVALLVSFGGAFHYGYQLTIPNPSQEAFLTFLNDSLILNYQKKYDRKGLEAIWSIIVASLYIGAIIGSLSMKNIADKFGRKRGLIFAYFISLISSLMAILGKFMLRFEIYAFSRLSLGFSLSLSLGLAAMFLTESSPKYCRGIVGMTTGIMLQLGTVVGSIIALPEIFGNVNLWWLIYCFEIVIFIIVLLIIPFVYESPGYLVLIGKEELAKKSIQFFYNPPTTEIDQTLNIIKDEIKLNKKSYNMLNIWSSSDVDRRGTIIGCVVAFAMAFSGIAVIDAFAVEILRSAKVSLLTASLANVGLTIISLIACVFSSLFIDHFGRRSLLLISCTIILFTNISIFGFHLIYENYSSDWVGACLIISISIFVFAFAIGPGPLCFFLSSEMVSQNARSAAQSWTSLVLMSSHTFLLMAFLPLKNFVNNSWAFLILFVAPILFSMIFLYFRLPETKNRNLQEVEAEFKKLPKFGFKKKFAKSTNKTIC